MIAAGARRAPAGSLWRNGDFLAVWSGQIVSTLGSAGSATVVPLLVLATTGSAADAGLIAAVSALPRLLLQLPAGALIDRWDRLRVMRVSETLAGLALLVIPTMLWFRHLNLVVLVGAVSVQGCCRMLYGIAELVALPAIVPDALLGDAIAQNEAKSRAAGLIGPMLGGALFGLGRAFPFVVDAVSSLVAAVALRFVRADLGPVKRAVVQPLWSDIAQGLVWILRHSLIRTAFVLIAVSNMVFQALSLILIVLARSHGASPAEIGLMFGIYSVGGLCGALTAPRMNRRLAPKTVIMGANWVWAGLLPLFLLTENPLVLGAIGAASAFLGPIWNVVIDTYGIVLVPEDLRGRVSAAAMTVTGGAIPVASAAAGYLLDAIGAADSIVVMSGIMLGLAIVGSLSTAVRGAPARGVTAAASR